MGISPKKGKLMYSKSDTVMNRKRVSLEMAAEKNVAEITQQVKAFHPSPLYFYCLLLTIKASYLSTSIKGLKMDSWISGKPIDLYPSSALAEIWF